MRNVIIMGPPGAGKGTQAARISSAFALEHLSTGDVLRGAVDEKTDLGIQAKSYMDSGELVPDQLVIDIIASALESSRSNKGFLFDGFPRTKEQAKSLDKIMERLDSDVAVAINLAVPEQVLIERVLGREDSRTDDTPEVLQERLRVYQSSTFPLLDYYRESDKLKEVDGNQTPDEVFADIKTVLESAL